MFEKKYEIVNGPKGLELYEYLSVVYDEFIRLLEYSQHEERAFQLFFEENPICMPGAFEIIGTSGHCPHNSALICQPKIGNLEINRFPDFMWLAQDSTDFCPVLIEIERADKRLFSNGRQQSADFSQAIGQINEWKTILDKPTAILDFYEFYDIPIDMRRKNFSPQYCLIYGRRDEFIYDENLCRIRGYLTDNDIVLMSYDRVLDMIPNCKGDCLVGCTVSEKTYHVKHIMPVYKYRPGWACDLSELEGFREKIDEIRFISDERKEFLKERYLYWVGYGKMTNRGMSRSLDAE